MAGEPRRHLPLVPDGHGPSIVDAQHTYLARQHCSSGRDTNLQTSRPAGTLDQSRSRRMTPTKAHSGSFMFRHRATSVTCRCARMNGRAGHWAACRGARPYAALRRHQGPCSRPRPRCPSTPPCCWHFGSTPRSSTSARKTLFRAGRDKSESLSSFHRDQLPPCVGITVRLPRNSPIQVQTSTVGLLRHVIARTVLLTFISRRDLEKSRAKPSLCELQVQEMLLPCPSAEGASATVFGGRASHFFADAGRERLLVTVRPPVEPPLRHG
jgi:hypothetical protein